MLDSDRRRREVRQPGLVGFRWLCKAVGGLRSALAAGAGLQARKPYIQSILDPRENVKDKLQDCQDEILKFQAFLGSCMFQDFLEKRLEDLEELEADIS
eukprot:2003130-Pyramimonas_sp.AAC.1